VIEPIFGLAERLQTALDAAGVPCALIGAHAMAAHGVVRATSDLDLALCISLPELRRVATLLEALDGVTVELSPPDPSDPLGGVVNVEGAGDLVQLVNFYNSTRADHELGQKIGEGALRSATAFVPGVALRIVDLPHLVALKLYSWDRSAPAGKSYADAKLLLDANPGLTDQTLLDACNAVGLRPEVEAFLRFARPGP